LFQLSAKLQEKNKTPAVKSLQLIKI